MADFIIHHNGAFNIWSTVVDAPRYVSAITREQLHQVIREEQGQDGIDKLPYRLARVLETGCSSAVGHTLEDCIAVNRAGPNETRLSREEFIRRYLTLPSPMACRVRAKRLTGRSNSMAESIGFQIESWVCYGMPEAITAEQRAAVTEYALSFEECGATRDELATYSDQDLIHAAYGAMADYARGQM